MFWPHKALCTVPFVQPVSVATSHHGRPACRRIAIRLGSTLTLGRPSRLPLSRTFGTPAAIWWDLQKAQRPTRIPKYTVRYAPGFRLSWPTPLVRRHSTNTGLNTRRRTTANPCLSPQLIRPSRETAREHSENEDRRDRSRRVIERSLRSHKMHSGGGVPSGTNLADATRTCVMEMQKGCQYLRGALQLAIPNQAAGRAANRGAPSQGDESLSDSDSSLKAPWMERKLPVWCLEEQKRKASPLAYRGKRC